MENQYILFAHKGHENFYYKQLKTHRKNLNLQKPEYKAFFYLMGINKRTRHDLDLFFDFKRGTIRPCALDELWADTDTQRLVRFAFNLFNGWVEPRLEFLSAPSHTFETKLAPYLIQALVLRYPWVLNRHVVVK